MPMPWVSRELYNRVLKENADLLLRAERLEFANEELRSKVELLQADALMAPVAPEPEPQAYSSAPKRKTISEIRALASADAQKRNSKK